MLAVVVPNTASGQSLITDPNAVDQAMAAQRGATRGSNPANPDPGATPDAASEPSSGAQQIYVDPATGRTIVAPAGSDAGTLPPGFVPIGAGSRDDQSGSAASGAGSPSNAGSQAFADQVAPAGKLPGDARRIGNPRTMSPSDDPNQMALDYITQISGGLPIFSEDPLGNGFIRTLADGSVVTYRPAGQASWRTPSTTTSVDVNNSWIMSINGGNTLKLKFPSK